ncbi:PD40 domain-containing protein, partial [Cyanobacteria bacterium FACHB-63]|nr:PD40 domain-containing protein [Cyanobacteria bacterium FACHB-63]
MTPEAAIALIEQLLEQRRLTRVQEIVFRQSWEGKTYAEMARDCQYDPGHLKDVGSDLWRSLSVALNEKITKTNFHSVIRRAYDCTVRKRNNGNISVSSETVVDWCEAIDVSYFDGRTAELDQLSHWVGDEENGCRLIALLGMGGIGKTSFAVKLAQQVKDEYQFVIWRSLKDAPPLQELLKDLIKVLSHHQDIHLPERTGQQISKLMQYLQSTRCLIILDNFETILADGQQAGTYLPSYEVYGELLQRVGEVPHVSCLLLTSREKPAEVAALEGEGLPVRAYSLSGLDLVAAKTILQSKGLSGSQADTEILVQGYQGNPLALKIASTSIVDLFEGDIREFLDQGTIVFNGIRNLLTRQISRCSEIETQIMYWLAINREPVSVTDLQTDLHPTVSRARLLEALESLRWRSLIEKIKPSLMEKNEGYFIQQPVVMEYMTDLLIEQMTQALLTGQVDTLNQYALIKAQAKDYIRESQIRVILDPIANNLKRHFNSLTKIEQHCQELLQTLRKHYQNVAGYAAGNLINLLRHFNIDLTGYDFSELAVWQAYLQGANLNRVNFSQADLSYSRFTNALTNSVWVEFSPDGTHLATSDANGSIRLWNPNNGQEILSFVGHLSWTWAVRFSPKGDLLASCSGDYTIRLWDTDTGLCLRTLLGHTSSVWAVSFSSDGKQLASSSLDQTVRIWDIQSGQCLCTIEQTGGRSIAFSPDGKRLAIVQSDQTTIALWDVEKQRMTQTLSGHTDTIWSLAFSPDGTLLASGSEDQTARLWWIESGDCHAIIPSHMGCIWTVAFSPTGSILGLGSDSGVITLWDFKQQAVRQTLQGHSGHLWSISFAPNGQRLASSAEDQTIRLWLVKTGQCSRMLQGYNNRIRAMAINSTGLLACATNDSITLRNLAVEHGVTHLKRHIGEVYSVAFSPDGSWLASGCNDGTVKIWDVNTAHCLQSFRAHTGRIFKVLFHPTQSLLISAGSDSTIRIWDLSTFRCLYTLTGHTGWIFSAAFSHDGQYLATGSDGEIKLWDTKT